LPGDLPARRIDRDALERIIQRAAELQAGEMDTGESMTEAELLKLGADVGIDGRFLRQAMYEQAASGPAAERGLLTRWFGPAQVFASRVVAGDRAGIEEALEHWMTEGEALAVKRRMPDRTVWEQQRGFFAQMKRGFGVGGRSYQLARALDVTVGVTQLEAGYCHVEVGANVSQLRAGAAGGFLGAGGTLIALGALVTAASVMPVPFLGLVPIAAGVLTMAGGARFQRRRCDEMQLALEQVLDRLEHGEIRPRHKALGPSPLFQFADDLRRAITEGVEQGQRRRLRP
jgi:MprA protease rhombosortase-interaction domain-containing protein